MKSFSNEILVCNFTDSYAKIEELKEKKICLCDLTDVEESNGYCSDEAAGRILKRLENHPVSGIHYIDDGNHHYVSRLWIGRITEPFDLIVFDHHTDMQPSALLPFLSCGNWILKSLQEVEMLKDIWIVGPPKDAFAHSSDFEERVHIIPEETADADRHKLSGSKRPVYVSVDLDVLSPEEFTSIWDQGSMTKKKLEEWMARIQDERDVIGIDLCG